jgi:hypothetical protein
MMQVKGIRFGMTPSLQLWTIGAPVEAPSLEALPPPPDDQPNEAPMPTASRAHAQADEVFMKISA